MLKQSLGIFALLATGIIAGVVFSYTRLSPPEQLPAQAGNDRPVAVQDDRIAGLEAEIDRLNARIAALESLTPSADFTSTAITANERPEADGQSTRRNPAVPLYQASDDPVSMTEGLIAAGLDQFSADEIARKQSAVELRRLELRDMAIREGNIGSDDYREAMMEVRREEVNVRDEVDPDIYDRYLYHTGQTNRVAVQSVMIGSAAENAGVKAGDVLLSYDGDTIYNYRDLRAATLEGEVTDFVNLRVERDGAEINMTVSRGSLGVRLDSLRVNPDED